MGRVIYFQKVHSHFEGGGRLSEFPSLGGVPRSGGVVLTTKTPQSFGQLPLKGSNLKKIPLPWRGATKWRGGSSKNKPTNISLSP